MTDSDGVDPRYDPRFQRGYVPEAADDAPDAAGPQAAEPSRADGGIDPRYDPRFQRGYDPERHRPTRRMTDERPVFSSSLKATPRTPTRGISPEELATAIEPGEPDDAPAGAPEGAEEDAEASAPALATAGRNPFLIGLWVASLLFVGVGVGFILQAANNPTARFVASVAVGDLFARTAWTVSPILVTVGLIGVVGLTLWSALRWKGKRE